MRNRPRLRKLIVISLVCYTLALSLAVSLHGHVVNEYVERLIWESMLQSEMTYIKRRVAQDPDYDWSGFDVFHWYDERRSPSIPAEFQALPEGVHDEIKVNGKQFAVLVEHGPEARQILALDITDIENRELAVAAAIAASFVLVIVVLTLLSFYSVDRLLRPLTQMADDISNLRPDGTGRKIAIGDKDPHEIHTIAAAINGFTDQIREHIERERRFINMASHELRTPIAVMSGVTEVVLDHPETTPAIRQHLLRSKHITDQMEDLVAVLLALARAPETLAGNSENLDIQAEVPTIVADHDHLCRGKNLSIAVELASPVLVIAPRHILRVAIGNLLRNAIENCDRGVIRIYSDRPGTITIDDPGQGMTPVEMSGIYTRMAKSGQGTSGGIGIDLIMRICAHFGWKLDFESVVGRGTKAILSFH
ncbi:MAG: HAMP domain-containing histidine kinase [Sinobacteraceae bacterium]|nr:HAMP domain-containing histidine kinase [Nevskiaceae bacterium]